MKKSRTPSKGYVIECLDYNPKTGVFVWKSRPASHFKNTHGMRIFNSQRAGTVAGNILTLTEYKKEYMQIRCSGFSMTSHRLAWIYVNGDIPEGMEIDHINGNGLDNRIENLRLVSRVENGRNLKKKSTNKSGVTGVSWSKDRNKWVASIMVGGKTIYLGRFSSFDDAVSKRKSAEIKYGFHKNHGKSRNLNSTRKQFEE